MNRAEDIDLQFVWSRQMKPVLCERSTCDSVGIIISISSVSSDWTTCMITTQEGRALFFFLMLKFSKPAGKTDSAPVVFCRSIQSETGDSRGMRAPEVIKPGDKASIEPFHSYHQKFEHRGVTLPTALGAPHNAKLINICFQNDTK